MKLPADRAAIVLRGASYGTVTPMDVIRRASGVGRTWARTAADRLSDSGFLERTPLHRVGPGRPTFGYMLTAAGQKFLDAFVDAEATRFKVGESAAGPTWSLAHYGLPLAGQRDAFVARPSGFTALEEIRAPSFVLREPTSQGGVLYPAPERLVLWLLGTGDERNVLLAPILARRQARDWDLLWRLAEAERMTNRLAYVLHVSGQGDKIPAGFRPNTRTEQLVTFGEESDEGRRFHVTGTVSAARLREFETLYGTA